MSFLFWELSVIHFQYNSFIKHFNKMTTQLENIISLIGIIIGVLGVIGAIYWLIKTRTSKKERPYYLSTEENYSEIINLLKEEGSENITVEMKQLAEHTSEISQQIKINFRLGLIFAIFGFIILLFVTFLGREVNHISTVVPYISITIIEVISVLFFSRSNKVRKEMKQFFNNIRKDKQLDAAKKLIEHIEDPMLKDILRVQLTLYYSGIQNDTSSINSVIQEAVKNNLKRS